MVQGELDALGSWEAVGRVDARLPSSLGTSTGHQERRLEGEESGGGGGEMSSRRPLVPSSTTTTEVAATAATGDGASFLLLCAV